jgi:hypothetical protein
MEAAVRRLAMFLVFWMAAFAQAPMLNLVVVEGEGQINNIRQRTAREPVVQVEDENHKPVAGAIVVFTTPSNGASGVFANGSHTLTVTTDEAGRAVARGLRPNAARGEFQIHVNVSSQGRTANKNINQTNAVLTAAGTVAAGGAGHGKLIAILAAVGAAAAGGIVYATQQGGGSSPSTPAAASPTTISAGSGTVGPPR